MYIHNLNPALFDFGFLVIRWYSLAYIFGILFGWWLGKKLIKKNLKKITQNLISEFDNLITYLILSIIIGGRIGYVLFYNIEFYILNPIDILKIWEGGMSFHGALVGIIIGTYIFSAKRKIKLFFSLDIIACVSPIGIFLVVSRISSMVSWSVNQQKMSWGVIFPKIDNIPRHPSQLYEAFLEGLILFLIMNFIFLRKKL